MIQANDPQDINVCKLRCPISNINDLPLFFSLVDYRNNLFTHNEPEKILEFYNGFDNRDQLIQWMKERPNGVSYFHEVEGDKDIIVVITTADFNGKYAINCRENIFKGLHVIFVESGGKDDIYFNYAHNCNVGIKKAMEYNPKWIVVSNDDMIKIDDVDILVSELKAFDYDKISVVFAKPSKYHSLPQVVGVPYFFAKIYYYSTKRMRLLYKLKKKFEISYTNASNQRIHRLFIKQERDFINIIDFGIFSSKFILELKSDLFDEVFINHFEDTDLSLRISLNSYKIAISNYEIGSIRGGTFDDFSRELRSIPSLCYFNRSFSWTHPCFHK